MTNNKIKDFLNNYKLALIAVVVGLLVVGNSVSAEQFSFRELVAKFTGEELVNKFGLQLLEGEESLGSEALPDCNNNGHLGGCPTTFGNLYSEGGIEVDAASYFDAAVTLASGLTSSGDTRAASFVQTGSIASFTTGASSTAANVCDSRVWTANSVNDFQLTLPVTTTLFADCLTTNGDRVNFTLVSLSSTSTVSLFVGGGGNMDVSSSTLIYAGKSADISVSRVSSTAYQANVINLVN